MPRMEASSNSMPRMKAVARPSIFARREQANVSDYGSSNGESLPQEARLMSAYATNDPPSFFGRRQAEAQTPSKRPAPAKTSKKSLPITGRPTSSTEMIKQMIPTMKTFHQEILGRLDKIESMIAQGGLAATSESLQEGQSQFYNNGGQDGGRRRAPPQRGVQAMRATLARRGTKRQRRRRGTKRR
jgi:hypothetical protein